MTLAGMKGSASLCCSCDGSFLDGSLDMMEQIRASCLWCHAIWNVALFLFVLASVAVALANFWLEPELEPAPIPAAPSHCDQSQNLS